MDLNLFVFPKPKPSYTCEDMYGQLIYIPRDYQQWSLTEPYISSGQVEKIYQQRERLVSCGSYKGRCIPCLYLPCISESTKILLYFHGNAEDVALTRELLNVIQEQLQVHVLVMEYEGYGVYEGTTSAKSVLYDSELVFQYVMNVIRFPANDIIVFGRSIGSGPASFLASKHPIHSLILMSAFTSLRAVVKGFAGPLLQYIVAERFPNKELMRKVKCPVFLMHGKKDNLVSCKQAEELESVLRKGKVDCVLHMPNDMDHNSFDFVGDFAYPLAEFYSAREFDTEPRPENKGVIILPIKAFNRPAKI